MTPTKRPKTEPTTSSNGEENGETKKVRLQSSDGKEFKVDLKIAKVLGTVKTMFEDLGEEDDEPIPLPNVESKILEKVIEWATHHKDDPVKENSGRTGRKRSSRARGDTLPPWDWEFLKKIDQNTMFQLALAANYLDVEDLMDMCCQLIANTLRGKTPEQCRAMFNIIDDMTPEEHEQIRKENQWCTERPETD